MTLVDDAYLAALATHHDAAVATFDRDFARFPQIEIVVPGVSRERGPVAPDQPAPRYAVHMCARTAKPRSTARGIHLPSVLDEAIQKEAEVRGSSWSALTMEMLDEALRQRRAPGVAFVDGATGRRAVVAGTGLEVWEIVAAWKDADEDLARTRERLQAELPFAVPRPG